MKFKNVDIRDFRDIIIKPGTTQKSRNISLIEEFVASNKPVAEVIDDENRYKNPNTVCTSMKEAVNRGGYRGKIGVITRRDKVYMLNKDLLPQELKFLVSEIKKFSPIVDPYSIKEG